jgi:hypothetical protein
VSPGRTLLQANPRAAASTGAAVKKQDERQYAHAGVHLGYAGRISSRVPPTYGCLDPAARPVSLHEPPPDRHLSLKVATKCPCAWSGA